MELARELVGPIARAGRGGGGACSRTVMSTSWPMPHITPPALRELLAPVSWITAHAKTSEPALLTTDTTGSVESVVTRYADRLP